MIQHNDGFAQKSAGFTLLELMVVGAVFALLSAIVLANNSRFGNVIVLQNLAHDMGLTIREAQVYGISVKRCDSTEVTGCTTENQFKLAYGMHFVQNSANYQLFADLDASGAYTSEETVKDLVIAGGYRVSDMCLRTSASSDDTCGQSELNIVFLRPEPDACINGVFVDSRCVSNFVRAKIIVASNRDDHATIIVERSGQISVQ